MNKNNQMVTGFGIKTNPPDTTLAIDPRRREQIDPKDSWDRGMHLHLYGTRYSVFVKSQIGRGT